MPLPHTACVHTPVLQYLPAPQVVLSPTLVIGTHVCVEALHELVWHGLAGTQLRAGSPVAHENLQLSQPSPFVMLPSSHSSLGSVWRSPQRGGGGPASGGVEPPSPPLG